MEEPVATAERLLRSLRDPPTDDFLLAWPKQPWRRREVALYLWRDGDLAEKSRLE
ncbi:MAG TPA: hypothetical protein VKS78_09705 [Roseiarcus sp.]|nr:hypothetical protein [Roseiarcus sp.]